MSPTDVSLLTEAAAVPDVLRTTSHVVRVDDDYLLYYLALSQARTRVSRKTLAECHPQLPAYFDLKTMEFDSHKPAWLGHGYRTLCHWQNPGPLWWRQNAAAMDSYRIAAITEAVPVYDDTAVVLTLSMYRTEPLGEQLEEVVYYVESVRTTPIAADEIDRYFPGAFKAISAATLLGYSPEMTATMVFSNLRSATQTIVPNAPLPPLDDL